MARSSGYSAKIASSAMPTSSGSGVFGVCSTSSGWTVSVSPCERGVLGPPLGRVLQLASGAAHEDGVEVAGLVGDVEDEGVLDQPGLLHADRVDDDGRQGAPVPGRLGLLHRRLEVRDRGRDAPHDRDRRTRLRAVDEPAHDASACRDVRPGVEAAVRLVEDEVER